MSARPPVAALIAAAALLLGADAARAQRRLGPRFEVRQSVPGAAPAEVPPGARFAATAMSGTLGSGLGIVVGGYAGSLLGWGGGDDPGLTGLVVGAAAGSVAGSALLAAATEHAYGLRRPVEPAVGAGILGFAGGFAGAAVAYGMGAREFPLLVGWCIGQGITVAAFLELLRQ